MCKANHENNDRNKSVNDLVLIREKIHQINLEILFVYKVIEQK